MKRKPVKKIHLTVKNRLSWEPLQQQWNLKTDGKNREFQSGIDW